MLSSMPMCFNLFGAMRNVPDLLPVFKHLRVTPEPEAVVLHLT